MISRWQWVLRLITRRLWFRASIFGLSAVVTALVAIFAAPLVPDYVSEAVGANSVDDVLKILASSMLAVATFSLGTMVAAFSAASSTATPRASSLLVEDTTSQNVLSTFIGAFIFSLVGIIALTTKIYGPGGRVILFFVTLLVIATVLVTFFKWIDYLSNLGRLTETIEKVEKAATESLKTRWASPYLNCSPLVEIPSTAHAIYYEKFGYVQHIDVETLSEIADEAGGQVYLVRLPGTFAQSTDPIAWTTWSPNEEQRERFFESFSIANTRTFEQDPRFGLIVLSEIASRALSPGINDPGTAIDIIGRAVRVLAIWAKDRKKEDCKVDFKNVFVPPIGVADLFDDIFTPIARDGAGTLEVGVRLQKAFISLSKLSPPAYRENALRHSRQALARSLAALELDEDKRLVESLALK